MLAFPRHAHVAIVGLFCTVALLSTATSIHGARSEHDGTVFQTPRYFSERMVIVEAENFTVVGQGEGGNWSPVRWGDGNYFATTIDNVFLSRQAALHAPANTRQATAVAHVDIPQSGQFAVLVRQEAVFHFSAGFRLRIAQSGRTVFDRRYGMREDVKMWAFTAARLSGGMQLDIPGACPPELLVAECSWTYGSVENQLWEGVNTSVLLSAGPATITLIIDNTTTANATASTQARDGGTLDANRNVDTILLTTNSTDVMSRALYYESGGLSVPLDGLLTQAGEVYFKFSNIGAAPMSMTIPYTYYSSVGPNTHLTAAYWNTTSNEMLSGCTILGDYNGENPGYWPGPKPALHGPNCTRTGSIPPGGTSPWLEVGSLMDPFYQGTWRLPPAGHYNLTVGVVKEPVLVAGGGQDIGGTIADTQVETIAQFSAHNRTLELLFDSSTRATKTIREFPAEFFQIVAALDNQTAALPPRREKSGSDNQTWPGIAVPTVYMSYYVGVRDLPKDLHWPSTEFNETFKHFLTMLPPPHVQSDCSGCRASLDPKELKACNQSMAACKHKASRPGPYAYMNPEWGSNPQGRPNLIIELGDEVNMALKPDGNASVASQVFAAWASNLNLSSSQVGCPSSGASGEDWEMCYNMSKSSKSLQLALSNPSLFYHFTKFQHDYGLRAWGAATKIIKDNMPDASVGANFSPGDDFTCPTFQFIRAFREMSHGSFFSELNGHPAMTLPWGEDWIWQTPQASPQITAIVLEQFQAGLRRYDAEGRTDLSKPTPPIMMFVMPMFPGQTPREWRKQLYSDLAHGMKMIDTWPFIDTYDNGPVGCQMDPVPELQSTIAPNSEFNGYAGMYKSVRRGFHELGRFDDIIRFSKPATRAKIALLFSETTDIWLPASVQVAYNRSYGGVTYSEIAPNPNRYGTYAEGKHTLFLALLHTQMQLDLIIEDDAVDGHLTQYEVIYSAETHISAAATAKLADWVESGGCLFATAGAGMFDEHNRTNRAFAELIGVQTTSLYTGTRGLNATLDFVKQDLPWAEQLDTVTLDSTKLPVQSDSGGAHAAGLGVFGQKALFASLEAEPLDAGTKVLGTFDSDGSPAVLQRSHGRGKTVFAAFLPGLTYFHPALPRRPVDRSTTDESFNHFVPTDFDTRARDKLLVGATTANSGTMKPATASEQLVDVTVLVANHTQPSVTGTVITLVNWSSQYPLKDLVVTLLCTVPSWTQVEMASGRQVVVDRGSGDTAVKFVVSSLEDADAIILR